jgi:uncharacterized membrane protein YdjX (TVP38/TMEM64 family)
VRSLVSVPAGLLKMRFKSFLIASTIGTAGWTAMLAGAGFKLSASAYDDIDKVLGPASNAILVVLVFRLCLSRVDPPRHRSPATGTIGGQVPDLSPQAPRVGVAIDVEQRAASTSV